LKRRKNLQRARQPQVPAGDRSRLFALWISAALLLGSLAAYWPSHRFGFVYDDLKYITLNPHVLGGLGVANVKWAFTSGYASNWHPITWLSHMLDVDLFGPDAGPMHASNARIHAINAALLFLFLHRATGALWRSGFVAALFAFHPLHVESVAWIAERKDLLSALFGILSLWCYTEFAANRRALFYLGAFVALAFGLMSKPMLVTWPCVMLLLDYWPLERFERGKITPLIFEKLPFFALSAASSIVTFLVQRGTMSSLEQITFAQRIANALVAYATYLAKTFWPANLAAIYPHPGTWPAWQVAVSALMLAAISAVAVSQAARRRYLLFGWLWYLGSLVPMIGLVQVGLQSMADRYTYLPLVGIFVMVGWGADDLVRESPSKKLAQGALAAAVLAACLVLMEIQLPYWKNGITLFSHALEVTTRNEIAHYNLGVALADEGQLDRAIAEFNEALKINPKSAQTHNSLGIALARRGQPDAAIAEFATALRFDPEFAPAHFNLGVAFSKKGDARRAIEAYRATLRLDPDHAQALNNLAWILATSERAEFRNGREAVTLAERACKITGEKHPVMLQTLAAACAETGDFDRAAGVAERAADFANMAGEYDLAGTIRSQLELYKSHRPFRSGAGAQQSSAIGD
jgi:protein O-mannosyl-transferase